MEEALKEIMGDSYKDGMSKEEIVTFISNLGKKDDTKTDPNTVPLEKYTAQEKLVKDLKKQIADAAKEAQAKADADKSVEQKLADQLKANEALQATINKMNVKSQLIASGISGDDVDVLLENLNLTDSEKVNDIATSISTILTKSISAGVDKKVADDLMKAGTKPSGELSKTVTKEQFDKMTYTEQMKFSQTNPQLFTEYMK